MNPMSETNAVPAIIPEAARLPATYEAAQRAIAECERVDECKTWGDKAAAIAAYARMAKNDNLRLMALRIQQRATRRMGELLKQTSSASEANLVQNHREAGSGPSETRTQIAAAAGLSDRQRKQAIRVANVPADEFESAVDGPNPPSVSELAARGTQTRPVAPAPQVLPADPLVAAQAQNMLREFAAFCGANDPVRIAIAPSLDADFLRGAVETIDRWIDRFVTHLPDGEE
jgi:hypothetical protein